jgi:hypothetical protein
VSDEDRPKMLRRTEKNQAVKRKRIRRKKVRVEEFPVPVLVPDKKPPPLSLPASSIDCYNLRQNASLPKSGRFAVSLQDLEVIVPWDQLAHFLLPIYPEHGVKKRRHYPLASMMRINLIQRLHALSDSDIELALYELPAIRRFAQLNCSHDGIPDIPTIERFRLLVDTCAQAASLLDQLLRDFD